MNLFVLNEITNGFRFLEQEQKEQKFMFVRDAGNRYRIYKRSVSNEQ